MRFRYVPDFSAQLEETPRVRQARFGDGYEQRSEDGVNTLLQRWSVQFANRTKAVADEILAFLRAHRGVTPFDFALPDKAWSVTDSGFGVGDGVRTQFLLQRLELLKETLDWRGEWPAYTKPRTNYVPNSTDPNAAFVNTVGGTGAAPVRTLNAAVAPDGTMTAMRVDLNQGTGTTTADFSGITRSITNVRPGIRVCSSVWLRTADGTTRKVSVEAASGASMSIVTVTPEWQRFSASHPNSAIPTSVALFVRLRGYAGAQATDTQASLYVWGPQFEFSGDTQPTRYIPNPTSSPMVEAPRFLPDASGGFVPAKGWGARPVLYADGDWRGRRRLYEEPRTNLLARTEDLSDAYWSKNSTTVTVNATAAPDGTTTADKLLDTTSNVSHTVNHSIVLTLGAAYTLSFYAKAAEYSQIIAEMRTADAAFPQVRFDLATGSIAGISGLFTGTITAVGNGWYRCTATIANIGTGATAPYIALILHNGSAQAFAGTGTSGVFVWGLQLEQSREATSYIPATGAAAVTVTDYSLSESGVVTLSAPLAAGAWLSFDGAGEDVRRVVCRGPWRASPEQFNNYSVSAEFEEVMG